MKLEIEIKNPRTEESVSHKVGVIWGLGAFEIFTDATGIETDQMHIGMIQGKEKITARLTYSAIQNWFETLEDPEPVPFSYRQFQAWLSEAPQSVAKLLMDDYTKSSYYGRTMEEFYEEVIKSVTREVEEGAKKKSASVKSSISRSKSAKDGSPEKSGD